MSGQFEMKSIWSDKLALFSRTVRVAAVLFLASGAAGVAVGNEYVTPQTLTRILNSGNMDEISLTMNEVKRQNYKGDIIPFIVDLWRLDREKQPDLPWDTIETASVRLEVAHILVQSVRNGYVEIDTAPMHAFARSQVVNGTPQDIVIAIMVLLTINDSSDIPLLKETALKENPITFRMSVIAISDMCDQEPREAALRELADSIRDKEFLQYLEDHQHKASKFRRSTCFKP
jgi:hypothetical protein